MKFFLVAGAFLLVASMPLSAQVAAIDDDFEENDPCEEDGGWKCIGNGNPGDPDAGILREIAKWATWFSPDPEDLIPCDPLDDPDCANLFDPPEGYMRLTGPVGDARAVMWRTELLTWDDFRLTAEVELLGGTATPADGMTITIIGDDDGDGYTNSLDEFPGAGEFAGGGGMSATGHGDYPTMIFEFDNWDNGATDINNNHVGFEYSPTGFPPTDQVPSDAAAAVPIPLNGSGRFFFEVLVAGGVVACNLTNETAETPLPRTRMYTYEIPEFEPFEGYLGLTGSTGGANQHHILHSIRVNRLPEEFCIFLPLEAERSIAGPRIETRQETPFSDGVEVPVWQAGDVLDVSVTLSQIRPDSDRCKTPTEVLVTETVPPGWAANNISDGGTFDDAADTITWTLGPGQLTEGYVLDYQVTAADTTFRALFSGVFRDAFEFAEPGGITGDATIDKDSPFDVCGGIRTWNILGPYDQPGFATPDEFAMSDDYMTDGDADEVSFTYFPGAAIETDFDVAASSFLLPNLNGQNPGDVPTVIGWSDLDNRINVNDDVYATAADSAMADAQCYVMNTTGSEIAAYLGVSSDDSVAVIWNDDYHYTNTIDRGGASACSPQDITNMLPDGDENDPVAVEPGQNNLIVKTFNGGGGFEFSIVLLDADTLEPITEGLDISLIPGGVCTETPFTATRTVDTGESTEIEGDPVKTFTPGTTYEVAIALTDVRQASDDCPAAMNATLTETVPADWTVVTGSISDGGQLDAETITWSLTGGPAGFPGTLAYRITADGEATEASFGGTISDPDSGLHAVVGDGVAFNPSALTEDGFIKDWLLLGPYGTPTGFSWGANPSDANKRMDFLTDGVDIVQDAGTPREGDQVNTDYDVAASTRLWGTGGINPGGIPTWAAWRDRDATIDFDSYYGGDVDNVMMYAVTYIHVEEGEELLVDIERGSDDSVQILLDDQEIHIGTISASEVVPGDALFSPLDEGVHKIMFKVFEGGGDHFFRLRLLDSESGEPVTEGFGVCLSPEPGACDQPTVVPGVTLKTADVNGDAGFNISDPVAHLNFLFGGSAIPECYTVPDSEPVALTEAGLAVLDFNGDGGSNIADAVASLNFLFGGGPPPMLGDGCTGPLPGTCVTNCQ